MNINVPLWLAFAVFTGIVALTSAQEWFNSQYEVTRSGRFRRRVTRRWYGTHAHVRLRNGGAGTKLNVFRVIGWDDETPVPWLLVVLHNGTCWSESGEDEPQPFYAPVTHFAPYTVRRLRPHILRSEDYTFPRLFDYRPLRQPVRVPQDVSKVA